MAFANSSYPFLFIGLTQMLCTAVTADKIKASTEQEQHQRFHTGILCGLLFFVEGAGVLGEIRVLEARAISVLVRKAVTVFL